MLRIMGCGGGDGMGIRLRQQSVAHPTGYPWRVALLQSLLPFHRSFEIIMEIRPGVNPWFGATALRPHFFDGFFSFLGLPGVCDPAPQRLLSLGLPVYPGA